MADCGSGYDCAFVEKPPKIVQSECPVCLQILREPYQADCCGYAFCRVCIDQIKDEDNPCPCCKARSFDTFKDKRLKRTLYEFKVYCTNKAQGCRWVGELSQLENHLNSNPSRRKKLEGCQFTPIKCFHCSERIQRSSIQFHQSEWCPKRPFSCVHCKKFDSTYEDVVNKHWSKCRYYPVECTNGCGKVVKRKFLSTHISTDCPLTVIDCEFSHAGCKEKVLRKNMVEHLTENAVKHMSLLAKSYKEVVSQLDELKEENKQIKQQVVKLTKDLTLQQICTPTCPVEFMMTNFEQHKTDDDEWNSPPFYTHLKGYKMQVYVIANSYDEYDGTHMAVGVRLMKGEFDDQLQWPFRGKIIIRLLSQIDNGYKATRLFFTENEPDYDDIASRILEKEEEEDKCGSETLDFISHSDLKQKYLKNDCLTLCAYRYKKL